MKEKQQKENNNPNYFDKKKIYNQEIAPLIAEIKKICALNKIPCFTCVAVSNKEDKTEYAYDGVLTGFLNMELSDDRFSKHLCVANGFDVKPIGAVADFSQITDFMADSQPKSSENGYEEISE